MTAIDPPLTLQVSDDDKVLEPYRPATPAPGSPRQAGLGWSMRSWPISCWAA